MDGIYVAYLSASDGYTALLFVLMDGKLTGADAGGGTYSGNYQTLQDRVAGVATATLPPNTGMINGTAVGPNGLSYDVSFEIRAADIGGQGYITLQTPGGPVNAAVRKLQELQK